MKKPKLTHRLLACLPPALLLVGAENHFYLVSSHQLSPWLGAGFGMFATTDVGASRLLMVNTITAGGDRYPVTLNEPLSELAKRLRGLLDRTQSRALSLRASSFGTRFSSLASTLWRRCSRAPDSLACLVLLWTHSIR
jgi:hypothetical protein